MLFLGGDVGSTKTHTMIVDKHGRLLGFGKGGAGNPDTVGYGGLRRALTESVHAALADAGLTIDQISGAGFGVSGYDWPSQRAPILKAIRSLSLRAPCEAVNDAILGLLAGSSQGWGLAVVSGTGCNCRGWDRERRREGRVTGNGAWLGEGAGASELMLKAVQAVAHAWTKRGPATRLTQAFLDYTHSSSVIELLDGVVNRRKKLDAAAAPLVFRVAAAGDPVAQELIIWAGTELGELANSVIRQLQFEALDFEVILVGSMFESGQALLEPMRQTIQACAPGARLVRLRARPVAGAVLLAMEAASFTPLEGVRERLSSLAANENC